MTDPTVFFRTNRQYIVKFEAIQDIVSYTNSHLQLVLQHAEDHKGVIVSREKVNVFKAWLDK